MARRTKLLTLIGFFIICTQNCMHPLWGYLSVVLNTYYHYTVGFTATEVNNFISYFYMGIYVSLILMPLAIMHMNKSLCLFLCLFINSLLFVLLTYVRSLFILYLFAFLLGLAESLLVMIMNFMLVIIFPKQKSLAISFCNSGISIAILSYSVALTYMVNPNNLGLNETMHFPIEVSDNVPAFLWFFGESTFIVGMIGLVLIGNFDANFSEELKESLSKSDFSSLSVSGSIMKEIQEEEIAKLEIELEEPVLTPKANKDKDKNVLRISEMQFIKDYILTKLFGLVFVIALIRQIFYIYSQNNFKIIALIHINDDHFVSYAASITFILNFIARIVSGYIMDKLGLAFFNQITFSSYFITIVIYIFFPSSKVLYVVAISFIRIYSGFNEVLINGSLYMIYHKDEVVRMMKYFMIFFITAPVINSWIEQYLLEESDYTNIFWFYFFSTIVGMVVEFFASRMRQKMLNK